MVKPQLVEEVPVPLAVVKAELEKIQSRDDELSFRAGKCTDYLNDFVTLSSKKAEELKKHVEDLGITRLKKEHIVMIVDLLPQTAEDVRVIFQGSTVSISKKDTERIVTLVKESV